MAWEDRGGNRYYYRSVRDGGKVRKEYVGTGLSAELAAEADRIEREEAKASKDARRLELERMEALAAPVLKLDEAARILARAHLVAAGCHRHKGEWRRGRST